MNKKQGRQLISNKKLIVFFFCRNVSIGNYQYTVVALIAVGLVLNAGGVKDVLLELFNKIIGA